MQALQPSKEKHGCHSAPEANRSDSLQVQDLELLHSAACKLHGVLSCCPVAHDQRLIARSDACHVPDLLLQILYTHSIYDLHQTHCGACVPQAQYLASQVRQHQTHAVNLVIQNGERRELSWLLETHAWCTPERSDHCHQQL
jgi:hypothetical protein